MIYRNCLTTVGQRIISTQREAQMKLYSFLVISCILFFSSLQAIPTTYAQDNTGAGGLDKIKAMLLRPAGWKVEHYGTNKSGLAEFIYEARGENVVVKIQELTRSDGGILMNCERDVTITSYGIKHDGCRAVDITLRFDPDDQNYPFKGASSLNVVYKFKAK